MIILAGLYAREAAEAFGHADDIRIEGNRCADRMLECREEIDALLFGGFEKGSSPRVADQHFCSGFGESPAHRFILDAPVRGKIEVKTEIIIVINGVLDGAEIDLFGGFFNATGEKDAKRQDDEIYKAIYAHKVYLRREVDRAEARKSFA